MVYGTTGGRQFLKISSASGTGPDLAGGALLIYDPGTLDPAIFAGGDPRPRYTAAPGYFITDFLIGPRQRPARHDR